MRAPKWPTNCYFILQKSVAFNFLSTYLMKSKDEARVTSKQQSRKVEMRAYSERRIPRARTTWYFFCLHHVLKNDSTRVNFYNAVGGMLTEEPCGSCTAVQKRKQYSIYCKAKR